MGLRSVQRQLFSTKPQPFTASQYLPFTSLPITAKSHLEVSIGSVLKMKSIEGTRIVASSCAPALKPSNRYCHGPPLDGAWFCGMGGEQDSGLLLHAQFLPESCSPHHWTARGSAGWEESKTPAGIARAAGGREALPQRARRHRPSANGAGSA